MSQFRGDFVSLAVMLSCLMCVAGLVAEEKDSAPAAINSMPDISGVWAADLPLGEFVVDDSDQPVNSFRIFASSEANFKVRYLGSRASRTPLRWDEKARRFEGMNEVQHARFIVSPTNDQDVLNCRIEIEGKPKQAWTVYEDTWRRVRNDSAVPEGAKVLRYAEQDELTVAVQNDTEELLTNYCSYLKKLGFELKKGQVTLRFQSQLNNAHYYHSNRSIVIDPRVVADKSVVRREYNHHALATVLGENSKEIFDSCAGIESGLADYLGCSACDDPAVGKLFAKVLGMNDGSIPMRSMDNQRSFTFMNPKAGRHDVGELISGTLWEMRTALGKEVLDPLLVKAWVGLIKTDDANDQIVRFVGSLLQCAQNENPDLAKTIIAVLDNRGLKLPKSD